MVRCLATVFWSAILMQFGWMQALQAGAAVNKITPSKPMYLAGHAPNRLSTGGVHDDLWARALVIQVGQERLAIVICDLMGLLRDDVQKIRQRVRTVPPNRVMVLCTHGHSAPDMIGLWGPTPLQSGRDAEYVNFVIDTAARTVDDAAQALQPATIGFAKTKIEGVAYNHRIREILDTEATVIQLRRKADGKAIATLMNFACHPLVLDNDQITADFCHWYYRVLESRVGGVALFANGALGGPIWPLPSTDPNAPLGRDWARAERYGTALAQAALDALTNATFTDAVRLEHLETSYSVRLENEGFKMALAAGVIPSGASLRGDTLTTESHLIRLGNAIFFTIPGEAMVNVGILLKQLLAPYGDPVFLLGLANDELGYIMSAADYYLEIYEEERATSVSSEIGTAMVQSLREMLKRLAPRETPASEKE